MGRKLEIDWQESAERLKELYKQEEHPDRRIRLLALWHLRQDKTLPEVAEIVCAPYRVLQHELNLKVPRPRSIKANEAQQAEWKKGAYTKSASSGNEQNLP